MASAFVYAGWAVAVESRPAAGASTYDGEVLPGLLPAVTRKRPARTSHSCPDSASWALGHRSEVLHARDAFDGNRKPDGGD